MRAIKATTISILALGLLAGSAVGVAAQEEAAYFTGKVTHNEPAVRPTGEEVDGVGLLRGEMRLGGTTIETTDSRLSGTLWSA